MSKDPEGWAFDFGCILHDNFNSDAVARIAVPFSAHGFRFAGTARPKTGFGMELLERLLVACFDPLNINWAIEAND